MVTPAQRKSLNVASRQNDEVAKQPAAASKKPKGYDDKDAKLPAIADSKVASAAKGITIKGSEDAPQITINFKQVIAGIKGDEAVLAVSKYVQVSAHRIERPENQDLAPFVICIKNPDGSPSRGLQSSEGHASHDVDHLVSAGTSSYVIDEGGKKVATLTVKLDEVNAYSHWALPSKKTEAMRAVWGTTYKGGGFDLASAITAGDVTEKTRAQVEKLKGCKAMFSRIRDLSGQSITKLLKDGKASFAYSAETQSCAMLCKQDDSQVLYLLDTKSGKMAGFYVAKAGKPPVFREAP